MSVSLLQMGGEAATNFTDQVLTGISASLLSILTLFLIPTIGIILTCKKIITFERIHVKISLLNFAGIILLHGLALLSLFIGGTGAYTVYDAYYSDDTTTSSSVHNLGLLVTTRLELFHSLINKEEMFKTDYTKIDSNKLLFYSSDNYNVTDINFNDILNRCNSDEAAELTYALANRKPTNKNEYTGIFKGYNLISICAESFSPYLISEELTPTLYKLANNGFIFNNFYASFDSVTTNGEYAYCLGMFPDLSRSKSNNSFIGSVDNSLPYALGNQFKSVGADTYAYHNFLGTFYKRNITHPNMGYEVFETPDNGLDIAPTWPSSDYDMMVQSVDDYIDSGKQFHAYYMTFSGHYQYDWANIMCARNKSKVKDLDYPLTVRAYLSSNLELEKAMTYLMNRLEEAQIADKTVIVITTDHYPYGLSEDEYNAMAGEAIDTDFGKYRNSFICWNGGMKEAVEVNDICSTIDILPTLLNLFGFEYDSRLIIGRDILSDCDQIAILADQSFITPDYKFKASSNELFITSDNISDKNIIEDTKAYVKYAFSLSRAILNTNYYQYITEVKNG